MYKFVILTALVAVCSAQIPQDTIEVAQAKAAHFAALAEAQARSLGGPVFPAPVLAPNPVFPPTPVFNQGAVFTPTPVGPAWRVWDGVPAPIVVSNGQVQDTAEVAAEKAQHFALVADAAVRAGAPGPFDDGKYRHDPSGEYNPYIHTNVVQAPVFPAPGFPAPGFPSPIVSVNPNIPLPYQYTQTPVVVANGHVQDTPEVAALKAARLSELRSAGGTV